jgi:hypothetical protein
MNKYEQLIEHIINDNEQAAKELFHQIVVEKSRDIYESLMDEEMGGNQAQSFVQDITQQDDAASDQGLGEDDEEAGEIELDGGDDDEFGDEETFGGDDMDNMGDEHGEHGEIEAKIDELSAQLEELKAMLGGQEESGMDDMGGEEPAMDSDFDSEEPEMDSDEHGFGESEEIAVEGKNPFAKSGSGKSGSGSGTSGSGKSGSGKSGSGKMESYKKTDVEIMKEYVDKIGEIYKGDQNSPTGKMAGTGDKSEQQGEKNIKSVVRGQGPKFDGETASNIVNGGAEQAPDNKPIPEPKNEYAKKRGDLPGAGSFKNVPGGNAGKTSFKTKESAKTAEGSTTDGSVPVNKKSEIGGKVR